MPAAARSDETRGVHGQLALRFERDAATGTTRTEVLDRRPPLAVVRAFRTAGGAALVHVHNVSGGVVGGDTLDTSFEVGRGARAQVTTVGATQAYRSVAGREARHRVRISVERGGLLEYLPDPLIPFAGAVYAQSTTADLEDGAGLFWWEIVAPGRVARGECFAYERLALDAKIRACGLPIAVERFVLAPNVARLASPARLAGYRYFGTLYACRVGLDASRWMALEERLGELAAGLERPGEALFGCSTLPANGLIVRALAATRRAIADGFDIFWRCAKRDLYGEEAAAPRKTR
jgi:urease accessory protein